METKKKVLEYFRKNAEENYLTTPISVLRYISELEEALHQPYVMGSVCDNHKPDLEHFMKYSESICKNCKQKV